MFSDGLNENIIWRCFDCDLVFAEPKYENIVPHPYWGTDYRRKSVCPQCGSIRFESYDGERNIGEHDDQYESDEEDYDDVDEFEWRRIHKDFLSDVEND